MTEIFFALWFFLPAGSANNMPPIARHLAFLNSLDVPLDFGKLFRGKRILGDNKTFRGLVSGFIAALLTLIVQVWFFDHVIFIQENSLIDYNNINVLIAASLFTIGALGGDAVESFIKRQINIKPGESWMPFDQIDWIIGAILTTMLIVNLPITVYFWAVLWGFSTSFVGKALGWVVGINKNPI